MLTPEEQTDCMSHLPSLDIIHPGGQTDTDGAGPAGKLVDGFFEANAFLQDDIRQFQVHLSVDALTA